jgi:hypothetical protein
MMPSQVAHQKDSPWCDHDYGAFDMIWANFGRVRKLNLPNCYHTKSGCFRRQTLAKTIARSAGGQSDSFCSHAPAVRSPRETEKTVRENCLTTLTA